MSDALTAIFALLALAAFIFYSPTLRRRRGHDRVMMMVRPGDHPYDPGTDEATLEVVPTTFHHEETDGRRIRRLGMGGTGQAKLRASSRR